MRSNKGGKLKINSKEKDKGRIRDGDWIELES
jgi:hypothetical protein